MNRSIQKEIIVELKRKSIHLSSLWMVGAMVLLTRLECFFLFLALTGAMLLLENLRRFPNPLGDAFNKYFAFMLRAHESTKLLGATYVLFAALVAILAFDKEIAICAFAIMIVSDTAAALVGKRWGRKLANGKSLEGAFAFVFSAFMVVLAVGVGYDMPQQFIIAGLLGAISGALVEFYAKQFAWDDNLTIVLIVGLVMKVVL